MPPESSRFERVFSRFSKSKRRNIAETPPNNPALTVPTIEVAKNSHSSTEETSLTRDSKSSKINDTPSTSITEKRNLWGEALDKLPQKLRTELEARGLRKEGAESFAVQIKRFQEEAKIQQARSEERDWKVRVGNKEIPVRQLTVNITKWATEIGDVAIKFALSPGAGAWGVITYLLQGIDTFDTEKSALLSMVDKVAGALFRGQNYYVIYTIERTKRADVVEKLHDALVELYSCVLELLVKSSDLSSNTAVQFCHAIFDTKKPSTMLSDLEQYEQSLQTTAELCEVTAHARQDDDLREHLQKAQAFLENFGEYMAVVDDREREKLLEWVSKVQYGRHFDEIEEKRSPGTGDWLRQHPIFEEWIDSSSSQALWLQGYPGTGKTYLTSSVVRHIMNKMESQKDGLAYFFCNHDESDRNETLSVLQSLVRQLAAPKSNGKAVRKSLQEARTRAIKAGSHLGLSECRKQLQESLNLYSTTAIIIDALDEVLDDELLVLIEELGCLMSQNRDTRVKLFISSRPEEEIQMAYNSVPTIMIQASENRTDIEHFVEKKLDDIEKTKPKSPVNQMRWKITKSILANCGNMFLWVDFQLKQIQRCKTIDAIEYELNNLPKGLTERYDRIMSQIEDNSFLDSQMAKRVLKWVMSAPEPLETEAITCAARINIQNDNIDLKSEMSSESLLAICENLLMIDSEGRWRFFHLSVREYLKEKQEFKHEAYLFCAKVCFLSLMKTFESPLSSSDSLESLEASQATKSPFDPAGCFALHLQTCWPFYASDLRRTDGAFAFLKKFLGSPNESSVFFVRWSDYLFGQGHMTSVVFRLGLSKTLYVISPEITPNKTPLFAIVKFSLYEAFCDASQDEDYNMLLRNDRGKTLLVMAADVDCIKICEVLITRLLSTNECYVQRDLKVVLASAARNGRLDVVKRLVEEAHADVNLNSENEYHGESLSDAAPKGGVEIVRYLMEKVQADVDLPLNSGAWGSVLISATLQGKLDVVRYLVEEAHADVNFVNVVFYLGGCGSVLAAASSRGNLKIVRYLVEEAHADVNLALQFGDYGSALAAAACQGSLDIVQYLVEQAHADVNLPLQCGDYGSALVAASVCGEMDIMEYLVTAGADVNLPLQSGGYGSALAAAAAAFHRGLEIVQYLVEEAHADVNLTLQCGEYGSALAAAAYQLGSLDIVRYLVEEAHAELNLPLADWSYANALAVAKLTEGNADVVEYLEGKADSESSLS